MSLKTLSSADKAAFQKAGIRLTPTMEHTAAEAAATLNINWQKILQVGVDVAIAILGAFGITIPAASTKKACAPGCCDHVDCCDKEIKTALKLFKELVEHRCQCCDECCHYG